MFQRNNCCKVDDSRIIYNGEKNFFLRYSNFIFDTLDRFFPSLYSLVIIRAIFVFSCKKKSYSNISISSLTCMQTFSTFKSIKITYPWMN